MALTEAFSGSASISTTEYSFVNGSTSVATETSDGAFQLIVDVNAMAAGDQYEFFLREKATSGGTQRLNSLGVLTGAQASPTFTTGVWILLHGWDFTAKKISGTDRTLLWSIRKSG
jgi:hypothetical protein